LLKISRWASCPGLPKRILKIAQAVITALQWDTMIPDDKLKIKVEDGVVKLEGEVEWEYQRQPGEKSCTKLSRSEFRAEPDHNQAKIKSNGY